MLMRQHDSNLQVERVQEAAARASLLLMTASKWRLVYIFEALVRFLRPLIASPQSFDNPTKPPASILVVEYWNLGDLAMLVPFLRNLRQSFPKAKISLLLNADLATFLAGQNLVDEFIPVRVPWSRHFNRWRKYNPFSSDWISLARTLLALRKHRFDWAFSGRMDVRDNFILWLSGARRRIAYGFGGGGSFLTDRIMPDLARPHRADVWLHLLEALGFSVDRKPAYLTLTDSELALARSHLSGLGIPPDAFLIGVHPGARIATRRWGEDRFAEIACRLVKESDAHILWFSEPGRSPQGPLSERCHPIGLEFRSFLAVLSWCRLLVCNDSGPMHLANLLDVPVVVIVGPTNPVWFGPRGRQDRVVIRPEFSCRPCFDYCIYDQPYCLRAISVEEVYSAVEKALAPRSERASEEPIVQRKLSA